MSVLEEIYASNTDRLILTLEIAHAVLPGGVLRYAQGYQDVDLPIEDTSVVTFTGAAVAIGRVEKTSQGRQALSFQVDDVDGSILNYMEQAQTQGGEVLLTFREYASSLAAGPLTAFTFAVTGFEARLPAITLQATSRDAINKAWPPQRYTQTTVPGLVYYNP